MEESSREEDPMNVVPVKRAGLARIAALALAIGALAAPAAAAEQLDQTNATLHERSAALNNLVREQPGVLTAMGDALAEAETRQDAAIAYGRRWEALGSVPPARFAILVGAEAARQPVAGGGSELAEGFDWGDAGVGLAFGLGLAAVAGGAALVARRHNRLSPR
jgi:hypothetical protein